MPWFVSEPEDSGWKLDPILLVERLREKWPQADIREIRDPKRKNYSHEWRMRIGDHVLDGRFDGGSGVVLDGDIRAAVVFALWFRSLIPSEKVLLFYDESYSMHVNLKPETTEADVLAVAGF
jgi:hypothetical protein